MQTLRSACNAFAFLSEGDIGQIDVLVKSSL